MNKISIKNLAVLLSFLAFTTNVTAAIYTTVFTNASTLDTTAGGDLGLNFLSGAPTGTFATLTFNSVSNQFTLSAAANLDSFFGANTFIDAIAFNTDQSRAQINDANVSGAGITDFIESTNDLPDFDTRAVDDFNVLYRTAANTELVQGETVTFTITGLNINCFSNVNCEQSSIPLPATAYAIRVNNDPAGNSNTAISWAAGASINSVSAVPELETSALITLGLGMIGFVVRRRKDV